MNIHHGNLEVYGYRNTSEGIELHYEYKNMEVEGDDKNGEIEENGEIIEYIKEYIFPKENQRKMSRKLILQTLKSKHNIEITQYKLNKFIKEIGN